MSDRETTIDVNLRSKADGLSDTRSQYDALFADLKKGVAEALKGEGVDAKFISHVTDEFDRLNAVLNETGASGDEVAQKIAKLEQNLQAAAATEMKRVAQLKTNFEMALHEKDVKEEEEANQRRRRQEDQLWMEAEGRRLQENTEKLEQEIMVRLKNERIAREGVENTKQLGTAMQGTRRDIGSALLVGAQFADDMQYGLRGIMNQIPQLAAALGMGAGLAGVIGIAAVAVNLLWDKFGGASKAKDETDKVTKAVDSMNESLDRAAEAADEAFKSDLKKYTAEIEKATDGWKQQGVEIRRIISHHNELAELQMKIANSQLEIQRQNALAGASTDEERKAINARFDSSKAAMNDAGDVEKAKRNLDAEKANEEMLKKQYSNVSGRKDDIEGRVGGAQRDKETFVDQFGDQSDQGRRVREAEAANRRLKELQEQQRKDAEFNQERPATNSADAMARAAKAKNLQEEIDAAVKDRDIKNAGIAADKAALESGKGLKFSELQEEAAKAAKENADNAAALAKVHAEAVKRQGQIDAELAAAEADLVKVTADLVKMREAKAENERNLQKRELEVRAAEEKAAEGFAKAGTAKVIADKEEDAKLRKRQAEEMARKLENDAKEADINGDPKKAEDLRRRAERAKLPDDATEQQRRALELEQRQRAKNAAKGGPEGVVDASHIAGPLDEMAKKLGPAGSDLAKAVQQLRQGGATARELEKVVQLVQAMSPLLNERLGNQDKMIKSLQQAVKTLNSKLRTSQL